MKPETCQKVSPSMNPPEASLDFKPKAKSREDFVVKLIEEVKKRPQLWDRNLPNYNTYRANKLFWEEIAKKLNVKVKDTKEKWANLRECYRAQVVKHRALELAGKGGDFKPGWRHYHRMEFLKPFISHNKHTLDESTRQIKSNNNGSICSDSLSISTKVDSSDKENLSYAADFVKNLRNSSKVQTECSSFNQENRPAIISSDLEDCDSDDFNAPINTSIGQNTTFKSCISDEEIELFEAPKKSNILTENRRNTLLQAEKKTDKNSTKYENEDYYFAMSLLPSLAELSRERKIVARHRINQVLYEEYSLSKKKKLY